MLKEFKEFALSKTLIEVAVGLVMALALKDLVQALIESIIMPLVGAIFQAQDFSDLWVWDLNHSLILFGAFVTAFVTFLSIAAAVFFLIVKPYNAYRERVEKGEEEPPAPDPELELLKEIRDALAVK